MSDASDSAPVAARALRADNRQMLKKLFIVAVLMLHVVNSYVYFGNHTFWNHVHELACQLLLPLRRVPLRVARVDFAPLLVIAAVFFLSRLMEIGLTALYARLPI